MGRACIRLTLGVATIVFFAGKGVAETMFTFEKIVDTSGLFDALGPPALNDTAMIAFHGVRAVGISGIYRVSGDALKVVGELTPPCFGVFSWVGDSFSMNNKGDVAFTVAQLGNNCNTMSGIAVFREGKRTIIADTNTFLAFLSPVINDDGIVAFWGSRRGRGDAIFTLSNGVFTTVMEDSGFINAGAIALNNSGGLAFTSRNGQLITTTAGKIEFFPGPGQASSIALNTQGKVALSTNGGLFVFSNGMFNTVSGAVINSHVSINTKGTIAFLGPEAIYMGQEGTKLVAAGDMLFGSTVAQLDLGNESLNASDQIAFWTKFDNGIEAIVLASPILHDSNKPFRRGDSNGDGEHDLSDVVFMLLYLFAGGSSGCVESLDTNDDGKTDLGDPIGFLGYLFNQGFSPPPPFGACGRDPTPDELTCESFEPCR